mgnify:CR=1 FL=1
MASKECSVPCGSDVVTRSLSKVGICRSMLITLALLPFSWKGVVWVGHAIQDLWHAATTAVSG